jgi:hypothetical protein
MESKQMDTDLAYGSGPQGTLLFWGWEVHHFFLLPLLGLRFSGTLIFYFLPSNFLLWSQGLLFGNYSMACSLHREP